MTYDECTAKLNAMRLLQKNWNSYGADPPNDRSLLYAESFISTALERDLKPRRVTSTAMEGVAVVFYGPPSLREATIEFYNKGTIYCLLSDRDEPNDPMHVFEILPNRESYANAVDTIQNYLGKEGP